jgi:shikimate kinase
MENIKDKHIYLLIGPKGCGKSYIGVLFERFFNIKFFRVENWVLEIRKDWDVMDNEYFEIVFQTIESKIRQALNITDHLVFESTGLSEYFDVMLANLQSEYKVTTIKVNADMDICIERIRTRDQSIHVDVSDEQINKINKAVLIKDLKTDFSIENSNTSINQLKVEVGKIVGKTLPRVYSG